MPCSFRVLAAALLVAIVVPSAAFAQEPALAPQRGGQLYWPTIAAGPPGDPPQVPPPPPPQVFQGPANQPPPEHPHNQPPPEGVARGHQPPPRRRPRGFPRGA